jgi:hypothetical protein
MLPIGLLASAGDDEDARATEMIEFMSEPANDIRMPSSGAAIEMNPPIAPMKELIIPNQAVLLGGGGGAKSLENEAIWVLQ